ncbi:hypothetical protein DID88_009617 [Monilinia fructigena]|uniref:Xylanolytic transcriptional activator regulatory domain-containing protein n=1 Tax=Monilinia fructigena TaxID=38457 RepID=A0A395IPS3_9HELO|nr:hypothetical protein DID88_009617 [Monilinia fructigena]
MDPHDFQTSITSNDYFNSSGLELTIPQPLNNPIQSGPRSYKSRKYRPCDFCRARQTGQRRRKDQTSRQTMVIRMAGPQHLLLLPPYNNTMGTLTDDFAYLTIVPVIGNVRYGLAIYARAPTNRYAADTPWKTSLVGWTVSLAQILGLMKECSGWSSIPRWEINLRKRLWYGVFVMDKWASLGAGMPSHIHADDFDVLPLEDNDLGSINSRSQPGHTDPEPGSEHFRLLTELTTILSDIIDSYYTIRATQRTSKDILLSLELARPLRSRLKAWNDLLPPSISMRQPEHFDSHSLAQLKDDATINSRLAVRAGAKECAKEVVEFVENLGRGALDAFWHSWSRANFAIASSFLMQLLVTSENESESGRN